MEKDVSNTGGSDRFDRVLAAIDHYNRQDPIQILINGKSRPRELVYAERLSGWVQRRLPEASEALRIAGHGQHVGRWTIPRDRYPMDRGGYLRWREELKRFHSSTVAEFMEKEGYPADSIERVRSLMLKKNLSSDVEAQALEDALCLLFLETQFDELREKTPDEKMKDIIRKTWRKMSEPGRALALQLPLTPPQKQLIEEALAG